MPARKTRALTRNRERFHRANARTANTRALTRPRGTVALSSRYPRPSAARVQTQRKINASRFPKGALREIIHRHRLNTCFFLYFI